MSKHATGLFIGRFQPFHLGHLSALTQGLEHVEHLIVVVGSANRNFSVQNPLTVSERLQLVKEVLVKEQLEHRVHYLLTLDDNPNNVEWTHQVIERMPPFEVVIGNNNLVTALTQYKAFPQIYPNLTKRELLQGMIIRDNILKGKPWKNLVPEYLVAMLENFNLETRLKSVG